MTPPEPQPTEPPDRPFQYSLRSLFGLTGGIAVFFSVARTLGFGDAVVALAAIVVFVGIMKYPRRVHLPTGILLTLVAGALLWANLRPTGWEREFNEIPPDQLDAVTKDMFYRGWPLCPCMICLVHGMRFHPEESAVHLALLVDGIIFVMALAFARGICELCVRRRARRAIKMLPDMYPPPACSTSGPPIE